MIRFLRRVLNRILVNPRKVGLKDLNRILDTDFGSGRGTPIDRALIGEFLTFAIPEQSTQSRVIEFSENSYTKQYCPKSTGLTFNFQPGEQIRTVDLNNISGDLVEGISDKFEKVDLIIATQLLAFTSNPFASASSLIAMLKPNGFIVGTEPFCSPISMFDDGLWGDYFRFTKKGIESVYNSVKNAEFEMELFPLGNWSTTLAIFKGFCLEDNLKFEKHPDYRTATNIGYIIRLRE